MPSQNISLAFLGPEGTYSDEAAHYYLAMLGCEDAELVACPSFSDVFDSVERGRATYGVVATENSLEGPVTATLDNFAFNNSSTILGVHVVDIHHCLIMNPNANPEDIDTIASHSQGIGQCRRYLTVNYPTKKTVVTASTAESVRLAMEQPNVAAIASAYAAELYGARIVERDIEDRLGNQTSFALIGLTGTTSPLTSPRKKTSIALFIREDRAGTLHMILSELAYANVNITMIQSRPTKRALGDYMFFLDLDATLDDPLLQTALNCLRMKLREVKILGCYPIV